jgi:hypothetical protein
MPRTACDDPIIGNVFGRLLVIDVGRAVAGPPAGRVRTAICRCLCGNDALSFQQIGNLNHGKVRSCGCLKSEVTRARQTKHGHARAGVRRTPEYEAYLAMLGRCHNPNDADYPNWGGRGIEVCERWRGNPSAFLVDMGPRPSAQHSLGRIDNDGPYSPENCRWEVKVEQIRNRSNTRRIEFNGETLTLKEWATRLGVKYITLYMRLREGWPVERALTTGGAHG